MDYLIDGMAGVITSAGIILSVVMLITCYVCVVINTTDDEEEDIILGVMPSLRPMTQSVTDGPSHPELRMVWR